MITDRYKVSVALFITSVWQLNFIPCYLSVLKEKKGMQISEARTKIFTK